MADPSNTWSTEADILAAFPAPLTFRGVSIATDDQVTQLLAQNAQLLAQNSHLAQALYDVTKALSSAGTLDAALLQDARAHVNALNPAAFSFS